jgi:hypothetical protein
MHISEAARQETSPLTRKVKADRDFIGALLAMAAVVALGWFLGN